VKIEEEIKQPRFRNDHQKALLNLTFTSGWLAARQEEFFKGFGITASQFNILRILRGQEGKSISGAEIKERMLDRNSDISRLLDRLAKKDLIQRSQCPNDKRATDVGITRAGLQVLKSIDKKIDETEKGILLLTPEEARQLSKLLDKARG
jgi:DNA-binding MarR family transcriptional regulator